MTKPLWLVKLLNIQAPSANSTTGRRLIERAMASNDVLSKLALLRDKARLLGEPKMAAHQDALTKLRFPALVSTTGKSSGKWDPLWRERHDVLDRVQKTRVPWGHAIPIILPKYHSHFETHELYRIFMHDGESNLMFTWNLVEFGYSSLL